MDLHVFDAKGGHAYYKARRLASGGTLSTDVTQGYGPERFEIEGTPTAGPYRVQAHYYRRGPMGSGMGTLHMVHHRRHAQRRMGRPDDRRLNCRSS